jgi:aspartyl aminopeptidase
MHSSYETAGAKDTEHLITALTRFYSSSLNVLADGEYVIE